MSSLHALLSGARMNVNARISSGAAKKSPNSGNINNPANASNKLTNNMKKPTTRAETLSLRQSFLFIVVMVDLLICIDGFEVSFFALIIIPESIYI